MKGLRDTSEKMSQFTLLKQRRFLPLFLTQFLGAFNDNIFKNALVIFIAFSLADQVGGYASQLVVIAGGVFILPFFLFSAIAGSLADKYEKGLLIRRIKLAEIAIMTLASVGFALQSLPILMMVLFLMGLQSTLFGPLKYGLLPQHLHTDELVGGNGLIQMATYIAILVGTIVGGVLVSGSFNMIWVAIVVLSIAVCGWLSSRYIPEAPADEPGLKMNWNIYSETCRIMGFARERRDVFISILGVSCFWFVGATLLSLIPSYVRQSLQGNEQLATLLLAAFSVGIGIGSLACERLSRGKIEVGLIPIGAMLICIFAMDLAFASIPVADAEGALVSAKMFISQLAGWHILLDLALIGAGGGLYIVPLYALVQHRCKAEHRARIIAANNVMNAFFMVASAVITTVLFTLGATIPAIFLFVAGLTFFALILLCWSMPEFIQRLRILVFDRQRE